MKTANAVCRLKRRPNSNVFQDNWHTIHQAMWGYFLKKRYGRRVTVAGTKP